MSFSSVFESSDSEKKIDQSRQLKTAEMAQLAGSQDLETTKSVAMEELSRNTSSSDQKAIDSAFASEDFGVDLTPAKKKG